jgi:DNA-binding SARP family transcriptional activator
LSDRLIDALWGERAPATAAKTVQVYVSNLRKALGAGMLITYGHGYLLNVDRDQVDVDRFDGRVAEGQGALRAGDPQLAARTLRQALGLWRGRRWPISSMSRLPRARSGGSRMPGGGARG